MITKTFGVGKYTSRLNGKKAIYYTSWLAMHKRCDDEKYQIKNPSYRNVKICNEWYNFQNFAKWFEDNYIEGFHLDKDILSIDFKIYSPETCCFVPVEINSLFTSCQSKRGNFRIGVSKYRKAYQVHLSKNALQEWIGSFPTEKAAFDYYKQEKEKYIKEVADKWRGKITEQVYNAMYNYKIKEND